MTNVAILGYGTVGSGVYEVIQNTAKTGKLQEKLTVTHILDIREFPELPHANLFTKNFEDIISSDADIVIEVMGGIKPAYEFTKRSLEAGKSVVTSNKELVATHGTELLKLAEKNNVNYMFEASVGGGIPIIRPLASCLAANDIHEILGILNGTTNYILSKMINDGEDFDKVLKKAQDKGYAERNPDADVLGHDACRKIAILASLASGHYVNPDLIHTEGITEITLDDAEFADRLGYSIKLIGYYKKTDDGKTAVRVSPMLIEKSHPLSGIEGVFNGIFVKGDSVGDCMFYGRGAGKLPTASAVVADVIDISKNKGKFKSPAWGDEIPGAVIDYKSIKTAYYVLTECNSDLSDKINAALETEVSVFDGTRLAFITYTDADGVLIDKISRLNDIDGVKVISSIRVLND